MVSRNSLDILCEIVPLSQDKRILQYEYGQYTRTYVVNYCLLNDSVRSETQETSSLLCRRERLN